MTPQKYKSIYTGAQIDKLLASVPSKLDQTLIVNDLTTGGATKIASAETVKVLGASIEQFKNPNYFKSLLLSIPDSNLYTNAEKAKLASLSPLFVGSFLDAATRLSALVTTNYTGREISFLVNDGQGLNEWSRWDTTQNAWVKVQLYRTGEIATLGIVSPTIVTLTTLDITKYTMCKVILTAKAATSVQASEFAVVYANGDTYVSEYGELGNSTSLYTITTSVSGNNVLIKITTTVGSTYVTAKKVAEI